MASVLEACMVVGFGISWPMNIIKSVKAKTAKGKSLLFLVFILLGYICGIASKIVMIANGESVKIYVFAFYILNFFMVLTDFILYFVNSARDKKAAEAEKVKA